MIAEKLLLEDFTKWLESHDYSIVKWTCINPTADGRKLYEPDPADDENLIAEYLNPRLREP